MRQISVLGFDWSHIVVVASRHQIDELYVVTSNLQHQKVRDAMSQAEAVVKRMGVKRIEARQVPTGDLWTCVEAAAPLFAGSPVVLDISGGVRALSLCLFVAAVLAEELAEARIEAVYTQAEDLGVVYPVDIRPLRFAATLRTLKSRRRQRAILEGELRDDLYGKKLAKEMERYGVMKEGQLTPAGRALKAILQIRT